MFKSREGFSKADFHISEPQPIHKQYGSLLCKYGPHTIQEQKTRNFKANKIFQSTTYANKGQNLTSDRQQETLNFCFQLIDFKRDGL